MTRRQVVNSLLFAGATSPLTSAALGLATPNAVAERKMAKLTLPDGQRALRAWWQEPVGQKPKAHLVLLHGSGERGDDLTAVLGNGVDEFMDQAAAQGWTVCAPQLEEGAIWEPRRLHALAKYLAQQHPTALPLQALGISLGGYGVWHWLWQYGADLAAGVSICGGWHGKLPTSCSSRRVPVRAYHGADDDVVPLALQQKMVDAHRACGATVEFTIYPGVTHGAWIPAFKDAALLPWLHLHLSPPDPMVAPRDAISLATDKG